MTAWPRAPIAIGPEMMGIGLSLANIAMADSEPEVRDALMGLWNSANRVRSLIQAARNSAKNDDGTHIKPDQDATAGDIRDTLDMLSSIEAAILDLLPKISLLLKKEKFSHLLDEENFPFGIDDLVRLLRENFAELQPALRELRLELILEVASRSKLFGIDVVPDDIEAFKVEFRAARFEDTMGWQETAHIAASPANAKRVMAAIASAAPDRNGHGAGPQNTP